MNWLDGLIVVLVLAAIIRGIELGFARQLFSASGFLCGLFSGAWAEGHLIHSVHTATTRTTLSLVIVLGTGMVGLVVCEMMANQIKSRMAFTLIDKVDRFLGSVVGAGAILAAIWLGASIFTNTPFTNLQRQIHDSVAVAALNKTMPPAPEVITKLGHLITPNGFPQVFTGTEPKPASKAIGLPVMGDLSKAVAEDRASVVKIEGEGCGGIVDGSGFVADSGIVMTNAHVIAGVAQPKIIDRNGIHRTTVIWFNPDLDLAVLRALDLNGKPLALANHTAEAGTHAAVLGYPGGGGFQADPAAIVDTFAATGRNIYNQGSTTRQIYSMRANVISGNSGGPLVDHTGTVIGIVFAHSVTYKDIGYALTMPQVIQQLQQAKQNIEPVGTGNCAE